jgi:hypothetical protein
MAFNFTTQITCLSLLSERNRTQPMKGHAPIHIRSKPNSAYQVDCIIFNALNFCLGGVWFESWPGHWLPCCLSPHTPQPNISTEHQSILKKFFPFHQPFYMV